MRKTTMPCASAHAAAASASVGACSRQPRPWQFAQFLTLRWGKVRTDLILEDTATWEAASRRLAAAGDIEAAGPPLTTKPA